MMFLYCETLGTRLAADPTVYGKSMVQAFRTQPSLLYYSLVASQMKTTEEPARIDVMWRISTPVEDSKGLIQIQSPALYRK